MVGLCSRWFLCNSVGNVNNIALGSFNKVIILHYKRTTMIYNLYAFKFKQKQVNCIEMIRYRHGKVKKILL